jgi:hypothetical protein
MKTCNWCGKDLGDLGERFVPRLVRYPAAVAMAFIHGGMWAMQWLAKPFCARCRGILVPLVLAGVAAAAAFVSFLVRLWMRGL